MSVDRSDSEQESTARAAVVRADGLLAERDASIPKNFAAQLFGRAVPEDIVRYAPEDLATLAEQAWHFIAERKPGVPKIEFSTMTLKASDGAKTIGVIEIVNDDMPFLVDSVLAEVEAQGLAVKLVLHPVFGLERDAAGRLVGVQGSAGGAKAQRESVMHVHVTPVTDASRRDAVVHAISVALEQVRLAVQDWRPMLARVDAAVASLKKNPPPLPVEDVAEAIAFLDWLREDNFTFLGIREYTVAGETLEATPGAALGVLRNPEMRVFRRGGEMLEHTPQALAFLKEPKPLIVGKTNVRSLVHRRVYLDYVGVKTFDAAGRMTGELRIVGLFTSTAYTRSARAIPYLRRKLTAVAQRAGLDASSHSGKALANVLETYPRDELFQIDEATLFDFAMAILALDEHPRTRVLARADALGRFVSVLVYVRRERYDSHIREAIGAYLAKVFEGRVSAFYPFFPEGPLVRVHFIIGRDGGPTPVVERATLELAVADIVRTWSDAFSDVLVKVNAPGKGEDLALKYRDAFSAGFRDTYSPAVAVQDVRTLEALSEARPLGVDFHRRADPNCVGLKVWSLGRPLPLSERVPVLENMGFRVVDERTFRIEPATGAKAPVWFHDMLLERADGKPTDLDGKAQLEAAFLMVMRGAAESDGFNALVLIAGLMWR
ncbi:MAG: NAD-glutamate dehydrogenase, partial [Pseudolabrys sp.]|nr:NAD-glutamate dehydrogenase [Pseudolabrys sp.]